MVCEKERESLGTMLHHIHISELCPKGKYLVLKCWEGGGASTLDQSHTGITRGNQFLPHKSLEFWEVASTWDQSHTGITRGNQFLPHKLLELCEGASTWDRSHTRITRGNQFLPHKLLEFLTGFEEQCDHY